MANHSIIKKNGIDFIKFVNASPSPFHVVDQVCKRLSDNGFKEVSLDDAWDLKPEDRCFITKNSSTVIAFTLGSKWMPGNGFTIAAAHTDSPCFRLKPFSSQANHGYLQLGVECYGGGIWHSWFDRNLTLAGRVILKNKGTLGFHQRLFHSKKPILRIPNIAIHLQRDINENFAINKETHTRPILATSSVQTKPNGEEDELSRAKSVVHKHSEGIMAMMASQLDVPIETIINAELCLADTQDATVGGLNDEFIFSPRLDNLVGVYTSLTAFLNSLSHASFQSATNVHMLCFFDNEEVGSVSAQGAASNVTMRVIEKISKGQGGLSKSMLVSVDQAHALHPNFAEKHEINHKINLNDGFVIKNNCNQRYTTSLLTASIMTMIADENNVPYQVFVGKNDVPCGSTIGPILASKLGIDSIDIGGPQLSMHSIQEMTSIVSITHGIDLLTAFFKDYHLVRKNCQF